jgi:hypothetical protein
VPDHPEGLEEGVKALNRFNELSDAPLAETALAAKHVIEAAAPAIRKQERQRIREALLSEKAIEAAGHASRTFAPFSPTSPQTWESVPDRDKARIRESARIYIGAALDTLEHSDA